MSTTNIHSSIFDLASDLIDAIEIACIDNDNDHEEVNVDQGINMIWEDNGNSSSIDILDDCVSALLLHHDNKSIPTLDLLSTRCATSGIDAHAVESHDASSTAHVIKQKDEDVDDILLVAARNRIRRDKARSKQEPIVSGVSNNDEAARSSRNQEVGAQKDNGALAYECFDAFRKEVQSFREQHHGSGEVVKRREALSSFVDGIEDNYIRNSLDELAGGDNKTVLKVKRLIEVFIARCRREESDVDFDKLCKILYKKGPARQKKLLCKFKYWTCTVCGKNDLLFDENSCSVCGRSKRHRHVLSNDLVAPTRRLHDPIKEEEEFLAGDLGIALSDEKIAEARIRRQYLYRKVDYDIDMRTELKNDVGDLLNSVRGCLPIVGDA